jgi:ABC-2 type transport system permease protein
VAIVDETGTLYAAAREAIMNAPQDDADDDASATTSVPGAGGPQRAKAAEVTQVRYDVEEAGVGAGDSLADVQRSLDERIRQKSLDGYVVLPRDVIEAGRARYYARNLGDVVSIGRLERRLNRAVKEERMRRENIDPVKVQLISKDIRMTRHKPGEQKAEGVEGSFFLALAVGMFIYIAILMYGQTILSAVVEEKTTRVVEVLFSSVKPFTLIAGKLVGVSLVGLTQYVIGPFSLSARQSTGWAWAGSRSRRSPSRSPSTRCSSSSSAFTSMRLSTPSSARW